MQARKVINGATWQATTNGHGAANTLQKFYQGSFWDRIKSRFEWENLTVAGREVKGFIVTPAMAVTISIVFVSAFLGAVGWAYKSSTQDSRETRDAVIRMETLLNERTRSFEREQDKIEKQVADEHSLAQLQRENQDKKLMQMENALKAKGVRVE